MANTYPQLVDGKFSIAAADVSSTIVIGNGSQHITSMMHVHIVVTSGTGSIAVKSRSIQPKARRGQGDVAFGAVPYISVHTNGSAGTGLPITTAITATSQLLIPSHAQEIALDLTNTSLVADVYVTPIEGSA